MSKYTNAKTNLEAMEKNLDEELGKFDPRLSVRTGNKDPARLLMEEVIRLREAAAEVRASEELIRSAARHGAFEDCLSLTNGEFVTVKAIEELRDAEATP